MTRSVSALSLLGLALLFSACGGGGGGAPPGPPAVNQAPTLTVTAPSSDVEVALGSASTVTVTYTDADPDSVATTQLIADADGSLATTGDQVVIATGRPDQDGTPQSVPWALSGVAAGTYTVFARTTDGTTTVVGSAPGFVLVNSPPNLTFTNLAVDVTASRGAVVEVRYTDSDTDDVALTWLFADRDGTRDTTGDQHLIAAARPEGPSQTVRWDTTGVEFGTYTILGQTWDGTNPPALRTATGRVDVVNASFATRAGGTTSDVAEDVATFPDGSSVVVGRFTGTATFGPGELNQTVLTSSGLEDIFVARYFAGGGLEWARKAGGTVRDEAFGVVAFADGTCVVTGSFEGAATFGAGEANATVFTATGGAVELFVARFNANGTLAWAKRAGANGAFTVGSAIAAHSDGSFVVSGPYLGDVTFGPGEANATVLIWDDNIDLFVARYNANGTLAWAKRATSTGNEDSFGIATFTDGSCAVTGYFDGTVTFGAGEANATTLVPFGVLEVYVARYNGNGTLAWASQAGGFNGEAVGLDVSTFADGTCVVSGWFTEFMDFGFGEPNETNFQSFGERDGFAARYGTSGLLDWAVQHAGAGFNSGQGVQALADGSCVVVGYFDGSTMFGLGDPNQTLLFSTSSRDLFIARLYADGSLAWVEQAGGTSTVVVPTAIALFADGSLAVTGLFDDGGVLFGEGGNLAWPVTSAGLEDVFLARYNADGGF